LARVLSLETVAFTSLALVAFAANSVLTRMALGPRLIDAASFVLVRLLSGAIVLVALVRIESGGWTPLRGRDFVGPIALFTYAAPFSFAYLRIGAAVGALVLFGAVQLTMLGWGIARGERPSTRAWVGFALAAGGLVALVLPSASRPDLPGTALMVLAGVSWGVYSLRGRSTASPLVANARNFLFAVPLALVLTVAFGSRAAPTMRGFFLAVTSGAVTSGLGYAIWYRALRGLAATQAAILQLSVPVLAATGAVVFLGERPTERLVGASVAILGGLALAISARSPRRVTGKGNE
jgi:drug/metabolite transporter (DMT)-like permease